MLAENGRLLVQLGRFNNPSVHVLLKQLESLKFQARKLSHPKAYEGDTNPQEKEFQSKLKEKDHTLNIKEANLAVLQSEVASLMALEKYWEE
jgi:hypothetical protein